MLPLVTGMGSKPLAVSSSRTFDATSAHSATQPADASERFRKAGAFTLRSHPNSYTTRGDVTVGSLAGRSASLYTLVQCWRTTLPSRTQEGRRR